jgi:hypothetical protein
VSPCVAIGFTMLIMLSSRSGGRLFRNGLGGMSWRAPRTAPLIVGRHRLIDIDRYLGLNGCSWWLVWSIGIVKPHIIDYTDKLEVGVLAVRLRSNDGRKG